MLLSSIEHIISLLMNSLSVVCACHIDILSSAAMTHQFSCPCGTQRVAIDNWFLIFNLRLKWSLLDIYIGLYWKNVVYFHCLKIITISTIWCRCTFVHSHYLCFFLQYSLFPHVFQFSVNFMQSLSQSIKRSETQYTNWISSAKI